MTDGIDSTATKADNAKQQTVSDGLNRSNGGIYAEKGAFAATPAPDLLALGFPQGLPKDYRVAEFQQKAGAVDAAKYAAQLEAKYHVSFSKNGKTARLRIEEGKTVSAPARAPNMRELRALDEALARDPSARGTKIYFLEKTMFDEGVSGKAGVDSAGHRALFMTPDWDKTTAATAAERKRANQATMSASILHEMAHNGHPEDTPVGKARETEIWQKLGWKLMPDRHWALAGKDGNYYEPVGDAGFQNRFLKKDAQGVPLDKNNKQTPDPRQMDFVEARTVLDRAKIRPMNDYIPHPREDEAEALSFFRGDKLSRGIVAHYCKPLYDQIKEVDQADIDRLYPPKNGRPSKIRSADGLIVDNTPANRARVAQFEKEAATDKYKIQ